MTVGSAPSRIRMLGCSGRVFARRGLFPLAQRPAAENGVTPLLGRPDARRPARQKGS